MNSRNTLLTLLLCALLSIPAMADTFTVTSNADSGPGTLRDAINQASANGTAIQDTILFNLPDVSRAGRTILLHTELPNLTSNLFIDGTSQPGTAFGISNAKVQVELDGYIEYYAAFRGTNLSDIKIWGMYLRGPGDGIALYFWGIQNFEFGAPGKGNLVTGFYMVFYSDNKGNPARPAENMVFQGNVMGIDESGDFSNGFLANGYTFKIDHFRNLTIGGNNPGEGNIMVTQAMAVDVMYTEPDNTGHLYIQGNKIGTDRTGMLDVFPEGFSEILISGYNDGTDEPDGTTDVQLDISNNIINGRLHLSKIKNSFVIRGNRWGVGADNVTSLGGRQLGYVFLNFCGEGMIGGPDAADKNYFAYAKGTIGNGIRLFHSGNITISQNSFFCNDAKGIDIAVWHYYNTRPQPFVTINALEANTVSGTALPNSVIELFYDDACPGCQGKTYIGSTVADAGGKWRYNGAYSGGVVATATDEWGATSEFSTATINTDSVIVKNATCGRNNGSVKKARVVSGTDWYWEDESGNIVGRENDLTHLAPGKYRLVSSMGGSSCEVASIWFEIKNIEAPSMDPGIIAITQPSCGLNNGSLKTEILLDADYYYTWINATGTVLNNNFETTQQFVDLFPGDYSLKLSLRGDSTCYTQYEPFHLINQSGPSLQLDNMKLQHATCRNNNGSISDISYQNTTGAVYIAWEDSVGNKVSSDLAPGNLSAGKYRLKFKDQSGCDTIVTPYYLIVDNGYIFIDSSAIVVTPSGCTSASGSITGLVIDGAEEFSWLNPAGNLVSAQPNELTNATPGTYHLLLKNHFGCENTAGSFTINQAGFSSITVSNPIVNDASCNQANASVIIPSFSKDTVGYRFRWIDDIGNTLTNGVELTGKAAGAYGLFATDKNGCTEKIYAVTINQLGLPAFNYSSITMTSDSCNLHIGSIRNLNISGGLPPYQWIWKNTSGAIVNNAAIATQLSQDTYTATVQDKNGCEVQSNPIILNNINVQLVTPQLEDLFIPRHTATTIKVLSPKAGNYELLADINGNTISHSDNGVFQTTNIDADRLFYVRYNRGDCVSSLAAVNIKVFDSTIVYVPTAFSPNNDLLNDLFKITVKGKINTYSLAVYNRWGQRVFASNQVTDTWDGSSNGTPLPSGVFMYVLHATDFYNRPIKLKGNITIVR